MNTELIAAELNRLSRMKLNGWKEPDIREEFITPLLTLLGYRKGTDYDINREGSHLLPKRPFFFIGRDNPGSRGSGRVRGFLLRPSSRLCRCGDMR